MDEHAGQDREEIRQAHVFASGLLSMAGNRALEAIVERAAAAFDVPIAAVSVIDRDRQFFAARTGFRLRTTQRSVSFCAHTLERPGNILCVPDTLLDPRFATSKLVTSQPGIRFYAGCPLSIDGVHAVGTLCLIDQRPRPALNIAQELTLRDFAAECLAEVAKSRQLHRHGEAAAEAIAGQIHAAMATNNEPLALELDRVLRGLERGIHTAAGHATPRSPSGRHGRPLRIRAFSTAF